MIPSLDVKCGKGRDQVYTLVPTLRPETEWELVNLHLINACEDPWKGRQAGQSMCLLIWGLEKGEWRHC